MTYIDGRLSRTSRYINIAAALLCIAVLDFAVALQVAAQTRQFSADIVAGAIACAASNNNTGHMVCAEYTTGGAVVGVSWQAPGTFPIFAKASDGHPVEAPDAFDPITLGTPAGTLVGAPSCASTNDGTGSASCLLIVKTSTQYEIQGVTFNPAGVPQLSSPLMHLDFVPLSATLSNPTCTSATNNFTADPNVKPNVQVICALIENNQLYGIGFELTDTNPTALLLNTGLQALPLGSGFTGNPSCTSRGGSAIGLCLVRQSNGTPLGVAFDTGAGSTAPVTVANLITVNSWQLPANVISGTPSCVSPGPATRATCAVVSGNALLGISFDPTARNDSGFESLGAAPDGGSWNGQVGCALTNDAGPGAGNLINCAAVSSTSSVFEVTFDPQAARTLGLNGPYALAVNGAPSCISLATDLDRMYCGNTTTAGMSIGAAFGIGLLPAFVLEAIAPLSND